MAIGDDAAAAGLPLVPGSLQAKDLDTEINRTRDQISLAHASWKPGIVLPMSRGGLGVTTPAAARTALGVASSDVTVQSNGIHDIGLVWDGAQLQAFIDGVFAGYVDLGGSGGAFLPLSGGTLTGHLYSPPARSTTVSTSYVACYINGDGRFGATPSALKYKRDVEPWDGSVLDLEAVTYVLKDDEKETRRLGIIADDANEVEPMLVVHEDGESESFKYELLAVGLLKEVQRLAARVKQLEEASA